MQVIISGKNIELTDAIKNYVDKKIGGLDKFYDQIIRARVSVGLVTTKHTKGKIYLAECKLEVPGNDLYASKVEEKDLYKAIDKIKDYLDSELKKHKKRIRQKDKQDRQVRRSNKEYSVD